MFSSPLALAKSVDLSSLQHDSASRPMDTATETDSGIIPIERWGHVPRLSSELPDSPILDSDSESESGSTALPFVREKSTRRAARNVKRWTYVKRASKILERIPPENSAQIPETSSLPNNFPRCATCAKALHERVWYNNRYFEHCQRYVTFSLIFVDSRCVRHAFIFSLPWPAHRTKDVQEYPPAHLITNGYVARKISSYPLPSLVKVSKRKLNEVESIAPEPDTKEQRLARHLRAQIEKEELIVEQLRVAAWAKQEAKEFMRSAAEEARVTAKRTREEAKKKRNENKFRGTGVWSRYEYVSPEEIKRRLEARFAVTSGTRRSGKYRRDAEEAELNILARAKSRDEEPTDTGNGDDVDGDNQPEHARAADNEYRESERTVYEAPSELRAPTTKRLITYSSSSRAGPSGKARPELLHPAVARKESRHSDPLYLTSPRPLHVALADLTPKRRGRPPGSGKGQRAALAIAARAAVIDSTPISSEFGHEAPTICQPAPASEAGTHGIIADGLHSQLGACVMTTVDDLRHSLFGPEVVSSPEVGSDHKSLPPLPPTNTDEMCGSGIPSIDAASPKIEVVDTVSSVEDDVSGEVEGEIVVALPDDGLTSEKGLKRKRVWEDEGEDGEVGHRRRLRANLADAIFEIDGEN